MLFKSRSEEIKKDISRAISIMCKVNICLLGYNVSFGYKGT